MNLTRDTLESIEVERSAPTAEYPQGVCTDNDCDGMEARELLEALGTTTPIRARWEEANELKCKAGVRADAGERNELATG